MGADWSLLKAGGLGLLPGFGMSLLVLLTVLFFDPQPHIFMTAIVLVSLGFGARAHWKAGRVPSVYDIVKEQFLLILWVLFVLYTYAFLGVWGPLGIIIAGIVIGLVILYKRREMYMSAVRRIETLIWGKPLDEKKEVEEHE